MPKTASSPPPVLNPQDIQQAAADWLQDNNVQPQPVDNSGQEPSDPQAAFDYKSSSVNPQGEPLPSGAQGWTPFGQPYFGPGLSGTIKKYTWSLMGSPTDGAEEDRWAKFLDLTKTAEFWNSPFSDEFKQASGEFLGGLVGTEATQESGAEGWQAFQQANERQKEIMAEYGNPATPGQLREDAPEEVRAEFEKLSSEVLSSFGQAAEGKTSLKIGGQQVSLLSPLLRLSKVGVQAVMDVLSEASIKTEQALGAQQAMREYADENSTLPDLSFDINREELDKAEERSEIAQNIANIATRVLTPALMGWDAMRFWTAPGTIAQKQAALKEGWNAGRVLYSQAIKPALLEEFKRRAAAGEDPQLLAQELQNPWAEMAGQMILDPLNLVGAFAKATKIAGQIDKAADAVRGGSLGDEAIELFSDAGKTMAGPLGETRAAERMGKFDDLVAKAVNRIEESRLTPDYNKLTAYSPSGMRVREMKTVQETSGIITSAIMRNGGSADEVADFFHYLSKATSTDKAARMEAWDNIFTLSQRFGMGRYPFSDDVLETGVLLRNLTEDKELLSVLKAGKGDLAETAKVLQRTFQRAVEKQIPTYGEVKKAAEAFRTGADTSKRAEGLAETYKGIKNKAAWNLHEGTLGNFKTKVNSFLGKFFFSQPGFVSRNASNNFVTMVVDQGFAGTAKSFYREGKYWSIADIEGDLRKYFGGQLPPATTGISSLSQAENATTGVTALNEAVESGFAKRIYWSRFRDTMDKFMRPGVALPKREEFKALGMTDEAIDHFTHILKNETYGNTEQAIIKYSEKFGEDGLLDAWKRWNGALSVEEMRGLDELSLTKQIDEITSTAKTPQEIRAKIESLRKELRNRAATATDNPVGVNRERAGFEFMDDFGKAAKEGYISNDDYNRLSILIEQSEKYNDVLARAIGKARDTVVDPALREQFGVMEEIFSAERRAVPRNAHKALNDAAWLYTNRSKQAAGLDVEKMWNESILAKRGAAPKGLTGEQFRQELWNATRDEIGSTWEGHFAEGFDRLSPLIDNLTQQFPEMQSIFAKAQKSSAELNMYRTAKYRGGKIFYSKPPQNVAELANRYGISSATEAGKPLDKKLLNEINAYSDVKYKTLQDAEADMQGVERALQNRSAAKGIKTKESGIKGSDTGTKVVNLTDEAAQATPTPNPETQIRPPYVEGSTPIPGQMWAENSDGILSTLTKVERYMLDNYGLKAAEKFDGKQIKQLSELMKDSNGRITEGMAIADKVGKEWRDFALLPYGETTNLDLMASYAFPYRFWYSHSYTNWMKRVATDPQVIANYARLKETMSEVNKDSPEWWRYNVEIPSHFLGLPNEHPMSFNLEANLWPLYGLTGTDFNDPAKRQNFVTSTIDDAGKFGPSMWAPIQWAVALYYRAQGEEELAQSWAGRLIPQTATIKAASSYFGQPLELDPMVQVFSGEGIMDTAAMDKYERNRVGRALAAMAQEGLITDEQMVEVARTQEGAVWDEAVKRAVNIRAAGQISSYFLGVGMKARTEQDKVTDEFYQEYYRLNNMNDAGLINPQDYQEAWDGLREKYPFMDALLLSRKAGPERERAYAFNVLGRIPPGQSSELYKTVGIEPELAQKFFDTGGRGLSESEQGKFMAAMVDLGAMVAMPEYASKQEWNEARSAYKQTGEGMKQLYGSDIQEKIDHYFGLEDQDQARKFMEQNPDVGEALDWQNGQIVNNPLLYEYYGGIKTLESFYKSKMYDELEATYGGDMSKMFDEYYSLNLIDPAAAKRFKRSHPEMDKYSKDKRKLQEQYLRTVVEFGARLPEGEKPALTGNEPQSIGQQAVQEYASQTTPDFSYWQQEMPEVSELIADYWTSDGKLPYALERELDYTAPNYGYQSGEQLLQTILIAMQRQGTP